MLSQQPEADALLDRDPLALVIGMVLDQQIPLEKAFSSPWVLAERLGHVPDAAEIAGLVCAADVAGVSLLAWEQRRHGRALNPILSAANRSADSTGRSS